MRRPAAILTGLALVAMAGPAPTATPAAHEHVIVLAGMHFAAPPSDLRVGDTILWVNRDIVRHTATARDGSFNLDLPPRAGGRTIVRRAGSIAFYCRYHPVMQGVLRVSAH